MSAYPHRTRPLVLLLTPGSLQRTTNSPAHPFRDPDPPRKLSTSRRPPFEAPAMTCLPGLAAAILLATQGANAPRPEPKMPITGLAPAVYVPDLCLYRY